MERKFKIVLVGDGGCGKTTLVQKLLGDSFEPRYIPTMGVEVSPLTFDTNLGLFNVNVWDCAGQEKFGGLREGYYLGADAFIVMFDVSSRKSYENAEHWANDVLKYRQDVPVILCGNKADLPSPLVGEINLNQKLNLEYFETSAKTDRNITEPFLHIIRKLYTVNTLKVVF